MSDKCSICKKNDTGKNGIEIIKFQHDGLSFKTSTNSIYCNDCKTKKEIERFNRYQGKLLIKENGKIKINWEYFDGGPRGAGWRYRDTPDDMAELLKIMGIFSSSPEGNWDICTGGASLCYNFYGMFPQYFTRQEHAMEYREAVYGRARYPVEIRQIGKTL